MQLPMQVQLAAALPAVALLLWAVRGLQCHTLRDDAEARFGLFIGTGVVLALRLFNTHGVAGVTLHFLGITIATLMFGSRMALCIAALASALAMLLGWSWQGWAVDFLITGALPIAVTVAVGWLVRLRLPTNIIVYVMGNAAAAGAVAIASSVLSKALISWLAGAWRDAELYLLTTPAMMFGEMFFVGGIMALVVTYRPQWCSSFNDADYLGVDRQV